MQRDDVVGLPTPGTVFEVDTYVFNNGDHADHRWVVVVRPPASASDYVTVMQRSSTQFDKPGVDSPVGSISCFTKAGRWVVEYCRSLRWFELEAAVQHQCGHLSATDADAVVAAWEAS